MKTKLTLSSLPGESRRAGHVSISTRPPHVSRSSHLLKQMCLSVYTQSMKPNNFNNNAKSLTGFGPASCAEKYLKSVDAKVKEIMKNSITEFAECPILFELYINLVHPVHG